jgi:hypothetical protein
MITINVPLYLLLLHLHVLLLLLDSHYKPSVCDQLVLRLRLVHCLLLYFTVVVLRHRRLTLAVSPWLLSPRY